MVLKESLGLRSIALSDSTSVETKDEGICRLSKMQSSSLLSHLALNLENYKASATTGTENGEVPGTTSRATA
jgi:hypothetical protein